MHEAFGVFKSPTVILTSPVTLTVLTCLTLYSIDTHFDASTTDSF